LDPFVRLRLREGGAQQGPKNRGEKERKGKKIKAQLGPKIGGKRQKRKEKRKEKRKKRNKIKY